MSSVKQLVDSALRATWCQATPPDASSTIHGLSGKSLDSTQALTDR